MFKSSSLPGSPIVSSSLFNGKKLFKKRKIALCRTSNGDICGSPRMGSPHIKGKNILRVCVLGSSKVGKTSIVRRMLGQAFNSQYVPTVYESYVKHVKIGDNEVILDAQDMTGSFNFPAMEKCAVENANVILIVFSLDDFQSCEHAVNLSLRFEENRVTTPIIIIGNKSDLYKGSLENREKIYEFINNSVQRRYLEMSAKFDRYADQLLKEVYEMKEIACGPYRVSTAKAGLIRM